jgi:hypothetical protein
MMGKVRKITSGLLLLVFLLPSIVKAEHRHKRALFNVTDEKTHQRFTESCPICNFEYSVFISSYKNIHLPFENPVDSYSFNYISRYNNNIPKFSFSLRAPPDSQV